MKRMTAFLLALCLTAALCSSAAAAEKGTLIDPTADRGIAPRGADENGLWPVNPVIPGESPTTGLPWEGTYYPILVMIDNVWGALPQYGIAQADIMYEMPIDIRMTRLVALYSSDIPEWAGPVRSTRTMHVDLRQEWGGTLVHAGGQDEEGTSVYARFKQYGLKTADMRRINIIGMAPHSSDYGRNNNDKKSPHNHGIKVRKLYEDLIETDLAPAPRPYLFTDEKPSGGDEAGYVYLEYGSGFDTGYEYDAEANVYRRYYNKGQSRYYDLLDRRNTLGYNNLIVQWTPMTYYNGTTNRPVLDEVGEGNADIFMGGRYIPGYWVRTGYDDRTIFFDSEGNEIRLQRGKTWITVAGPDFLKVTYRDRK